MEDVRELLVKVGFFAFSMVFHSDWLKFELAIAFNLIMNFFSVFYPLIDENFQILDFFGQNLPIF